MMTATSPGTMKFFDSSELLYHTRMRASIGPGGLIPRRLTISR